MSLSLRMVLSAKAWGGEDQILGTHFHSQNCLNSRYMGVWRLSLKAVAMGVAREPLWFPPQACSSVEVGVLV